MGKKSILEKHAKMGGNWEGNSSGKGDI
jgi:hypothetical protein